MKFRTIGICNAYDIFIKKSLQDIKKKKKKKSFIKKSRFEYIISTAEITSENIINN